MVVSKQEFNKLAQEINEAYAKHAERLDKLEQAIEEIKALVTAPKKSTTNAKPVE